MLVYKVKAKKGSSFTFYGEVYFLRKDHWTSIKTEQEIGESEAKYLAKANLMKKVAKDLVGSMRPWKRVYLDNSDLEVVRG